MDHTAFGDPGLYTSQWISAEHVPPKDMNSAHQISTEDMILHAATQMQTSSHNFPLEGAMATSMAHRHPAAFQQQHIIPRHSLATEPFGANTSFSDGGSQLLDRENDDGESRLGPAGALKSASSRSSANNELEMRQLFCANRHRDLQEVASELHGNERGPNSERTRQVFAMLWYIHPALLSP